MADVLAEVKAALAALDSETDPRRRGERKGEIWGKSIDWLRLLVERCERAEKGVGLGNVTGVKLLRERDFAIALLREVSKFMNEHPAPLLSSAEWNVLDYHVKETLALLGKEE